MSQLEWNKRGDQKFEIGVEQGVFYPGFGPGVPWNGLISVESGLSGGDVESYYFDGNKYFDRVLGTDYQGTLECFTFPREFEPANGSREWYTGVYATGQRRDTFGLSYKTLIGNDVDGVDHGYEIHLVYNATAKPTTKLYRTLGESVELTTMSYELVAVPIQIPYMRPTAHIRIDSTRAPAQLMSDLEEFLYGTPASDPKLPTPQDLADLFESYSVFRVIDNGDGTVTVVGPDEAVDVEYGIRARLDWPTVVSVDEDTVHISSGN